MGLLLVRQLAPAPRPRVLLKGREVRFDKALARPPNRGDADIKSPGDLLVGQAFIRLE
jgi:hypothetical protein